MGFQILLSTVEATNALGKALARAAFPGLTVALIGQLGAGKTTLTRAVAIELGVDPKSISSPTFGLIHEYAGRIPVYHFDAYRLSNIEDFVGLGVEEYFNGDGICLIEWADRVSAALPTDHIRIELIPGGSCRQARITAFGPKHSAILSALPRVDQLTHQP